MDEVAVRMFRQQMRLLQRRLRRELTPVEGLSRTEMQVLGVISRLAPITPRGVSDELRIASSNVAAALRILETATLVSRERDPADGRRVNLALTPAGATVVADFRHERDTWLGRAIETQLSEDEFAVLVRAGALMERLAAHAPDLVGAQRSADGVR